MWDNGKKIAWLHRIINVLFLIIFFLLAVLIGSLLYMQICT